MSPRMMLVSCAGVTGQIMCMKTFVFARRGRAMDAVTCIIICNFAVLL